MLWTCDTMREALRRKEGDGNGSTREKVKKKVKVWFYIAQYPVRWTAQSALHFREEEDEERNA